MTTLRLLCDRIEHCSRFASGYTNIRFMSLREALQIRSTSGFADLLELPSHARSWYPLHIHVVHLAYVGRVVRCTTSTRSGIPDLRTQAYYPQRIMLCVALQTFCPFSWIFVPTSEEYQFLLALIGFTTRCCGWPMSVCQPSIKIRE